MFPKITHLTQVIKAIKEHDEFFIADKEDYFVVNYKVNFEKTFPPVTNYDTAILRECRGIIFDKNGNIIRRSLHKFFNLNEKEETRQGNVDFSKEHIVLEKLDGSMAAPFLLNDKMVWGTKMGCTDIAIFFENFANLNPQYNIFSLDMIKKGFTPIFEFCSRKNRVVIDHPVDRMVLTAIRDIVNGTYINYDEMEILSKKYNIELVKVGKFSAVNDLDEFLNYSKNLINEEGFVVRFNDGKMLKVKSEAYTNAHRTLSSIAQEKDFLILIIDDKLDDLRQYLADDIANKMERYREDFYHNINEISDKIFQITKKIYIDVVNEYSKYFENQSGIRKQFALIVSNEYKDFSPIMFKLFEQFINGKGDIEFVRKSIMNIVKKGCSTQTKVDSNRHYFKVNWNDYYLGTEI